MPSNISPSRWAIALYAIVSIVMLAVVFALTTGDPAQKVMIFKWIGVNAMPLPYNDLYIPLGWIDCYRAGVPIFHCQVTTMQNNYPLTWLAFGWLGWGVKDVIWLSVAMEAVLFAALIPVVRQLPRGPVWPFFAILVSPPVFLALERCNIDILIATMMIAAGYFGSAAAFTLIAAGFMLKFFPLGAGAVLLRDRLRSSLPWLAALAVLAVAFMMSPLANLYGVKAYGVQGFRWAYGWKVLPNVVDELLIPHGIHLHSILMGLSLVCMFAALFGAGIYAVLRPRPLSFGSPSLQRWLQIGLGIYVTCFLLGYSYEYRFIFLLPTLPALLIAVAQNGWRSWEGKTVAFMIAAFWLTWDFVNLPVAAVQELCCWVLFILSVPLLIWSLPAWTVSYLRRGATR
jgi:hypothetical protein